MDIVELIVEEEGGEKTIGKSLVHRTLMQPVAKLIMYQYFIGLATFNDIVYRKPVSGQLYDITSDCQINEGNIPDSIMKYLGTLMNRSLC